MVPRPMSRPRLSKLLLAALAVLLLGAALSPVASASSASVSVVNGQPAAHGTFPYLAFVYFRAAGEAEACTGTVVASDLVLTAAHCVLDEALGAPRPPAGFRVVTGSVDWQAGERAISTVVAVAIHPDYAPSGDRSHWADAALLQLSRSVAAPPVKLAGAEAWGPGSEAMVAGWGALGAGQAVPSGLHYASTTVLSAADCGAVASQFDPSGELCVRDLATGASAACTGDSGGPLLVVDPASEEPLEIGIASFAVSDSCDPGSPQYYTRADLVAPWVAAEAAALTPPGGVAASLPRLGRRTAKGYARVALRRDYGGSFDRADAYRAKCEALEPSKRACAVSWDGGAFHYGGWVTVYYALESNRVVWRYALRVRRTALRPGGDRPRSRSAAGARGRSGPPQLPRRSPSRSA